MKPILLLVSVLSCLLFAIVPARAQWTLRRTEQAAPAGRILIRGVGAGPFDPTIWQAGTLNLNFDARTPLLEPMEGRFRNIYAPMAVREPDGWRLYYGAWDGVDTPNDRIYTGWTRDFLAFTDRYMVIDHGPFIHICNCCVIKTPQGYRMVATAYPHLGTEGLNRPIGFTSPDGLVWNGAAPYSGRLEDLLEIRGYPNLEQADINGMNALLYEDGVYRLYFADFRDRGKTFRATSRDFRRFDYEGVALEPSGIVNDVRRFEVDGQRWYLMGLHRNGDELYYALSRDGMEFETQRSLARSQSDADRYIVAIGWVTDGETVFGFLYGAGAVPALNENRLFAKWLQKKVAFAAEDGTVYDQAAGLGPDTLLLTAPEEATRGRFRVYAEDGVTLLLTGNEMTVQAGESWELASG